MKHIAIFLFCTAASASEVIYVVDGDTLDAIMDGKRQRVRLAQIDAPEHHQPYSEVAKQALKTLADGKDCDIEVIETDFRKRLVGQIVCDGTDINLEMIRLGYAWAYRKYLTNPEYLKAEEKAKTQGTGLWQDSNPIPPWEFRKKKKEK